MNRFDLRHIQTYTKLQCVFKSNEIDEQRIFLADDTFSCGFRWCPLRALASLHTDAVQWILPFVITMNRANGD